MDDAVKTLSGAGPLLVPRLLALCVLASLFLASSLMAFDDFRDFAPYTDPQMRPFRTVPPFADRDFDTYAPPEPEAPVTVPEYEEGAYDGFAPVRQPDVDVREYMEPPFRGYRPLDPIVDGPMRPIPEGDFQPYKPLGE